MKKNNIIVCLYVLIFSVLITKTVQTIYQSSSIVYDSAEFYQKQQEITELKRQKNILETTLVERESIQLTDMTEELVPITAYHSLHTPAIALTL